MKKSLNPLFLIIIFATIAITANAQLQEHIERGKQAYRDYADKDLHQEIRNSKEVTSYSVGDSRMFHRYDLSVMPPGWIEESATCRAVGERSYVFVADADWGTKMTQDDVDSVYHYLENRTVASTEMGIVEMDETYFGSIPDELDGDPKVIFYFSALGTYAGSVFDGYFSPFNQMTDAEAQMSGERSNECEMLYMSCDPVDPTDYGTLSVLSHELQHLIHFGHDANEETWVDEGCAEFAMVLFGHPDPITSFPSNSDNNLTAWDQNFSDYVKTMLFFTYLSEQTSGPSFITDLVVNLENGIAGIESTLEAISYPLDFQQIFTNWTLANYIDDTSVESGIYGYEVLDLPTFAVKQYFVSYPSSKTTTLNACAAHYYKFNTDFSSLEISIAFSEGGEWEMNLLSFDDGNIVEIIPFTDNSVSFDYPDSYTVSELILVVTNKEISTTAKEYSLSINDINDISDFTHNANLVSVYPNPATSNATINILTNDNSNIDIKIFNMYGQEINAITTRSYIDNNCRFDINTSALKSGIYLIDVNTGTEIIRKKLVIE